MRRFALLPRASARASDRRRGLGRSTAAPKARGWRFPPTQDSSRNGQRADPSSFGHSPIAASVMPDPQSSATGCTWAGGRGADEYLFALDLKADPPKELWSAKIGPLFTWKGNTWERRHERDPDRGRRNASMCSAGSAILLCVEAASGKEIWRTKPAPRSGRRRETRSAAELDDPTPLGWGYSGRTVARRRTN